MSVYDEKHKRIHVTTITIVCLSCNGLHLYLQCCSVLIGCLSSRQVTTARSVCGTWRVKPASRSSRLTERSLRNRSTMWRSIRQNATLLVLEQTLSPRCLYDAELRLPPQPRSLTHLPVIRDQWRHSRGRTFRQGSNPTSPSPLVSCRTCRLCSH